jgi:hypothetical protein
VLKYLVFTYPYRYQSGDLKNFFTFSFSFGDVDIIGTGKSDYELWWIQEGWSCVIAGAYY